MGLASWFGGVFSGGKNNRRDSLLSEKNYLALIDLDIARIQRTISLVEVKAKQRQSVVRNLKLERDIKKGLKDTIDLGKALKAVWRRIKVLDSETSLRNFNILKQQWVSSVYINSEGVIYFFKKALKEFSDEFSNKKEEYLKREIMAVIRYASQVKSISRNMDVNIEVMTTNLHTISSEKNTSLRQEKQERERKKTVKGLNTYFTSLLRAFEHVRLEEEDVAKAA